MTLAVVASVLFAYAAAVQHSAVGVTLQSHGERESQLLGPRRVAALITSPMWLRGVAVVGAASGLHVVALALAPVSIVQPVGVLAIPFGIMLTSRRTGLPPRASVVGATVLTVLGVAVFVIVAAFGEHSTSSLELGHIGLVSMSVAVVAVLLAAVAARAPGWTRCLVIAVAGAVLLGLASALIRTLMLLFGLDQWRELRVAGLFIGVLALLSVGTWLVQQAYATGPSEVVLGALTVIDPAVAVAFGIGYLGEGDRHGVVAIAFMGLAAATAALGTVLLARHHPDAKESST